MTQPTREGRVVDAVVSRVDSLLDDFDVIELLSQLTERYSQLLDVASAGLLLADPNQQLHLMAATSDETRDLEAFQLQSEQGPCLDYYTSGETVSVADVRKEPGLVECRGQRGVAVYESVNGAPERAGMDLAYRYFPGAPRGAADGNGDKDRGSAFRTGRGLSQARRGSGRART
jgi:hypothetical protein